MKTVREFRVKSSNQRADDGYRAISNAARLMRHCAGFINDLNAKQDGWKLYYAVDVDVIKLFMAPEEVTAYANVFDESDDAKTRELLARLLGDFIFRPEHRPDELSKASNGNLFIIPPHDEEIGRMIFALAENLTGEIDKADTLLHLVIEKLSAQLDVDEDFSLSQWLIDNAPELIGIFDGESGPRSELDRFESLEENRLLHIERYLEKDPLWSFPLLMPEERQDDFKRLTELFEAWHKRLLEHKTPKQTQYGLVRDAYVISMVEWLNEQMAESKRRVLLITGTHGVLRAAAKYRKSVAKGHSTTFADLYVRHPQFVMTDNSFFPSIPAQRGEDGESGFKLFDWLNLFFPKVIRDGVKKATLINTTLLERIEESADASFNETIVLLAKSDPSIRGRASFPESMIDEWQTQVRSACVARRIYTNEENWPRRAQELLDWLRSSLAKGWTVKQLRYDLATRALQSLSALYSSTVWLGLWSQVGTISEQVRGIPALRFDPGYELAQEYCRRVIEAMKEGLPPDGEASMRHLDIADMYTQVSKIDDSGYHGHLIHALAYATKGHWHAAKTLSKIALRTADELPEDSKKCRLGREAAYLLAICERRLARNVGNLDAATRYLTEAKDDRENEGAPPDLRFQSEAIAIDVARLNFGYFLDKANYVIGNDSYRILENAKELLAKAESDPAPDCRSWIIQQTATNAFNTALIHRHANGDMPTHVIEFVRELLFELNVKQTTPDGADLKDSVSEFIFLAARAVFDQDPAARTEARDKLSDLRFPISLPFDKARESLFREMANRSKNSPVEQGTQISAS